MPPQSTTLLSYHKDPTPHIHMAQTTLTHMHTKDQPPYTGPTSQTYVHHLRHHHTFILRVYTSPSHTLKQYHTAHTSLPHDSKYHTHYTHTPQNTTLS